MNYKRDISKSIIKVWEEFYINYNIACKILDPARQSYKEYKKKRMEKEYESMLLTENVDKEPLLDTQNNNKLEEKEENDIHEKFKGQLLLELQKVDFFYNENVNKEIRPKIKELKEQINHSIKLNEFLIYNQTFEIAFIEIYKLIHLMYRYIKTNLMIKNKLMNKYKKYFRFHEKENGEVNNDAVIIEEENEEEENKNVLEVEHTINDFILYKSSIGNFKDVYESLKTEVTILFTKHFTFKYKSKTEKILKKTIQNLDVTEIQSFYLGFFIGLLIFQFAIICTIAWYYDIDMDNDPDFKMVFPMFRGFFVLCIYWWVHGINILIWNRADINYKILFQLGKKNSSSIKIFKRAAIFTFILLSCVLIYMIKRIWAGVFFGIFDPIPINRLPLMCWGSLIIYWFCPLKIWNYKGREFLGNLTKESLSSFLFKTGFRHVFFASQLCSLIATMRDVEYTVCYYAYYDAPYWAKKQYCRKSRTIYFFISFFPNFIKILQSIREIHDSKKLFPKLYSIMKSTLAIFVSLLSFLWPQFPFLYIFWLSFAFISSCVSFTWDIVMDFGFFQRGDNYPLRNQLYYRPKIIYYLICLYNFILRFFWLLTISPEILGSLFRPETLSIILNSLEMTRRGCWNLLKVENKHIDISKEYKVTNDVELPYIKMNGKYVQNEDNLLGIMKMERQQKIQFEIRKIMQDNRSDPKVLYKSRMLPDLKELNTDKKFNNELNEYLEVYKRDTAVNIGEVSSNLNPTRRWAKNY